MKIALAIAVALMIVGLFWLYTPDESRPVLEARYLRGPEDYRTVAGIRLHVVDEGPRGAPVVILLHGFGSSLQTWDAWARLLEADHRVIRYDLPGFGLTGADPMGDYSDQRGQAVLAALMDALGVARATLIGNSMGGKLAWQFAAAYPARVERLVLVSPDGFASPGFEYGKTPKLPLMVRLLPYTLPAPLIRMSLAPAYGTPSGLSAATVARYRDLMLAPGVRAAMIDRMGQVRPEDPVPALRRITAPTLLLWGENDRMIPVTNAADYQRAIPHAVLVKLPGLGHVPFEEAPAVAFAPVRAFLAGGSAR